MSSSRSNGGLMRNALMAAALIIVLRIVLEQMGSPEMINNIFGVAWLYFILPILFALRIRSAGEASPFKWLLIDVVLFAAYTRLMVMATYMMAYFLKWKAPRFGAGMGGNVGDNVSFANGFLWIPFRNALIWVVFAAVVGLILGGVVLWLKRKPSPAPAA